MFTVEMIYTKEPRFERIGRMLDCIEKAVGIIIYADICREIYRIGDSKGDLEVYWRTGERAIVEKYATIIGRAWYQQNEPNVRHYFSGDKLQILSTTANDDCIFIQLYFHT